MQLVANNIKDRLMPASVKALVVDEDSNRSALVQELLNNIGYKSTQYVGDISSLPKEIKEKVDLLVVCTAKLTAVYLENLKKIISVSTVPVLMMSEDASSDSMKKAMAIGVHAYMVLGVQGNRMKYFIDFAFANYGVVQKLQQEIIELRTSLSNRIAIEKAKGLVMKNKQLDEEDAYTYLRSYAMNRGLKMVDVATMINEAEEIMSY